jgi:large subunit ribosomal protein L4
MHVNVYNPQGDIVGEVQISDELFDTPMNLGLVHQAVIRQRANARAGTASTKQRGEVRGGGRKPWKQKGTGRARAGTIRSPLWRGGGVTFGPKPRSYRQDMPKKMRRLALRCSLSEKQANSKLTIIDGLHIENPSTKILAGVLHALQLDRSILLVTDETQSSIILSARNIPNVKTLPVSHLNINDLIKHDHLLITLKAVRKAESIWSEIEEEYSPIVIENDAIPTNKRNKRSSSTKKAAAEDKAPEAEDLGETEMEEAK